MHIVSNIGNLKCVTLLVEHGVDINTTDIDGRTALFYCVINGKVNVLSYLLVHSANINARDIKEWTAIQLVYLYGRTDCVKKLITARLRIRFA